MQFIVKHDHENHEVKHSCSEVVRALTLGFEEHSGIDRKIHA